MQLYSRNYFVFTDCPLSRFCFALLTVYKLSTVDEVDVVSLNAIARCGTCQCMDVSNFTAALLSRWVLLNRE